MQYTEELTLVTQVQSKDEIGQIVFTETQTTILAQKNKVGIKEFYSAMGVGITPYAELQIKKDNYSDQQEVIYNGVRYTVIRTIPKDRFDIVLVIGVKQGVNNG